MEGIVMPNRILREGILTSDRVARLSWPAEVFYRRLMSVVDDFGRYWGKLELLRAGLYPLQLDKVGNPDVARWIAEAREAGLVRTYTSESKEYLELLDFRQHVRAEKSKFPQPPDICNADALQMQRKGSASAHVVGDGDGDGDERTATAPDASRRAPKVNGKHVAFDFEKGTFQGITEDDELRWQEAYPAVPIPPAISQAAAWLKANPANKKSNYERFLVNWFKRDQDKAARVRR